VANGRLLEVPGGETMVGRRRLTVSNPVMKAPTASAIETIYDDLLSNVAFKLNLRCYTMDSEDFALLAGIEMSKRGEDVRAVIAEAVAAEASAAAEAAAAAGADAAAAEAGAYTRPLLSST